MSLMKINHTINKWSKMTSIVLDLEKIPFSEMQFLLKDTYRLLTQYHTSTLVPKEISRLLLEMDGFLYFASLMEDKEAGIDFYHYKYISTIIDAMKNGFFDGEYECSFPILKICGEENEMLIDFETNIFETMFS